MHKHEFGSASCAVPTIGQGTWYIDSGDRSTAIAALQRGLDLGLTHIDTAEMYGSGQAEAIVGEAIRGRRDEVFLVSKVLPQNASLRGTAAACERSLKRLQTDRLDCYLLHWRGEHPLADTVAAFEKLKHDGKILAWGVSNFDVSDLDEVAAIIERGEDRLVCNQVLYHLKERAIEHGVLPWCEKHGVAVVAYSPFGHGNFPRSDSGQGKALQAIANSRGATPRQVALAFLTRRPSLFAIPKTSSPEHAEENAGAGDLQFTDEELAHIDEAFPIGRKRALPML